MNLNKSIFEIIDEIIEEFEFFDTWEDKYSYIIEMGRKLPDLDANLKVEDAKLQGCQSTVYFHSYKNSDTTHTFKACSDAAIVQGLIALLLRIYNNRTSSEILSLSNDFLKSTGLDTHLSITRKNGLASMINAIKLAASK